MKRGFLAVSVAGLLAVGGGLLVSTTGSAATAPNVTCQPGQTLSSTSPGYNNVTVPAADHGANFCNIQGATVHGEVTVLSGGAVVIGGTSTIGSLSSNSAGTGNGDVLGNGAFNFSVVMCNSTDLGTLTINGSQSLVMLGDSDVVGGNNCGGNTLKGLTNTVNDNRGGVEIDSNTVNGNLSVNSNFGLIPTTIDADTPQETTDVSNNADSTHKLTCAGNALPVESTGNTFASYPGGQCGP